MSKQSFTHYYVQAQEQGGMPKIVSHTYDEKKNKYYHKFMDRKKAKEFLESEKKEYPNVRFRIVKCTKTYDASDWV